MLGSILKLGCGCVTLYIYLDITNYLVTRLVMNVIRRATGNPDPDYYLDRAESELILGNNVKSFKCFQ